MLAIAVNGSQTAQTFTVTYTDNSTSTFTQSLSDWSVPQNFAGESKAVAMGYRDNSNGTESTGSYYLYSYSFALNNAKTIRSLTLPGNPNVNVLAVTLVGGSGSPSFSISGSPGSQSVTAGNSTTYTATVTALNGFSGSVALTASGLPTGAGASFNPTPVSGSGTSTMTVTTSSSTPGGTYTLTITGTSGGLQASATTSLVVSGGSTSSTQVNLSGSYNVSGIVADGTTFSSSAGMDRSGNAYSANLLGSTVSFGGNAFTIGPANAPDAVNSTTIALPSGQYSTLAMLAAAVNGNQANQTFTVTYSDNSTSSFTQSLSDWAAPANFTGEAKAATMAYRDKSNGTEDNRTFYLYGYSFALNAAKTVSSITLPANLNVVVVAITLTGGSPPTGDFSLSASPGTQTVTAGNNTTYTATVTALNGFSGNVALTASGLPTGAGASFNPTPVSGSGTSTMTVTTSSSTPAGTYTLTLTGTSGSLQHSTTVTLNVAGFSISGSPSSQTVIAGNSTTYTATVTALDGFSGNVALTASGLPTGAGASFNPTPVSGSGTSTMTVTTSSSTPAGTYTLTITGTSGGLQASGTVTLNVSGFSISASPGSQSVTAGNSTTYTATVTALNGFSGNVALTASGLPTGAGASFNPTPVSGSGTSTMTVTTSSSTPGGTYTLTITGTSGGLQSSATTSLVVSGGSTSSTQVNLSGSYNVSGIVADGTTFSSSAGMDRSGNAYSANLLGSTVSFGGNAFTIGPANAPDAVNSTTIALPSGQYSTLAMLAGGVNGNQANQTFTVTYSDNSTSSFTQSLSDWAAPANFTGEAKAATMAYRDKSNGTEDNRTFYLYGYSFALNAAKTVSSITLPANLNVVVVAITLTGGSPPTGDFSLSASPGTQTVTAGYNTTYTATVTALNGFSGNVALTASGLPTGAGASFNPTPVSGSGTSTMTVTTSSSTPAGTYTLTLTGTSGSLQHSTTVTLNVAGFSISGSPSSQTVIAGNSTTYTATVTALDGFSGNVALTASGLPTGAGASFNPTPVSGSGTSTMTVTTSSSTPAGTYTLTITGTSGGLQASGTVTLNVSGFSISASPGSQSVTAGNSTTYTATVTALNGFSGNVALTASGLPTGAGASFNPTPVSGSGTSTMTVTTSSSTPGGTYTLTITGTSGGLQSSATTSLVVSGGSTSSTQVNLSGSYNVSGIVADGTTFSSSAGMDRSGNAYSANLLGSTVSFGGNAFTIGPANAPDAVNSTTIALPSGQYSTLAMLAGASERQPSQPDLYGHLFRQQHFHLHAEPQRLVCAGELHRGGQSGDHGVPG